MKDEEGNTFVWDLFITFAIIPTKSQLLWVRNDFHKECYQAVCCFGPCTGLVETVAAPYCLLDVSAHE